MNRKPFLQPFKKAIQECVEEQLFQLFLRQIAAFDDFLDLIFVFDPDFPEILIGQVAVGVELIKFLSVLVGQDDFER